MNDLGGEYMSKVILVTNDPMFCFNCPLAKSHRHIITKEEHWFCGIGHSGEYGEWVYEPIDIDSEIKPDWCPLKPVPEKIIVFMDDWADGYNACLEDILGDGE